MTEQMIAKRIDEARAEILAQIEENDREILLAEANDLHTHRAYCLRRRIRLAAQMRNLTL